MKLCRLLAVRCVGNPARATLSVPGVVTMNRFCIVFIALLSVLHLASAQNRKVPKSDIQSGKKGQTDWPVYGGSSDNAHYSKLKQINTGNVAKLEKAWSYDTEETGGLETSPIIVDGVLYAYTPSQKIIALNAATGELIWKFASPGGAVPARAERGLAYWSDGPDKRLLAGVANYVYEINATTGKIVPAFGDGGHIDLRENLRGEASLQSVSITSPGV